MSSKLELLNIYEKLFSARILSYSFIFASISDKFDFQDILMNLAKQVASATAALVMEAKKVASQNNDKAIQNQVIANATQCALSTSQLVACTKVSVFEASE